MIAADMITAPVRPTALRRRRGPAAPLAAAGTAAADGMPAPFAPRGSRLATPRQTSNVWRLLCQVGPAVPGASAPPISGGPPACQRGGAGRAPAAPPQQGRA